MRASFLKIVLVLLCIIVLGLGLPFARVFAGNPPDQTNSSFSATEVPADGTTQSTITITLRDASNALIVGDTITIAAPGDPTISISPASQVSDSNGQVVFTATSTTAGQDVVNLTDTTTSTTINSLGKITFDAVGAATPTDTPNPNSSSSSNSSSGTSGVDTTCHDTVPDQAPNLYQINVNKTMATLYFTPPNSQLTGYNISYGLTASANFYSVQFNNADKSGAIKYTINDLYANTGYYFKVQAVNGCAFGPWSNTKSVGNISKLPATGPENLLLIGGIGGVLSILAGIAIIIVL